MHGLDALVDRQWREIWPTIRNFRFDEDALSCIGGEDASVVVVVSTWRSLGLKAAGEAFERRGRATIVLRRDGGRLRAVHTHLSLTRGSLVRADAAEPASDA